jgi:tetratricopeptide (TPR) repeat protein
MKDIVADFQKLVEGLSSSSSTESDLLLLQLDTVTAHRIRLCAIPHTFDADVLRVLDGNLDATAAKASMDEYQRLGAVVQVPHALALHDIVRQQLFQQWLLPERRDEFLAVSRRLAQHYLPQPEATAVERAANENNFVFHMVGADLDEGFKHFQLLYRERRERSNTSGCAILVRLVREYESILQSRHLAWLTFYEAEIAGDARDWQRAKAGLSSLIAGETPPALRSMVLLRLASVQRQSGELADAETSCLEALKLLDGEPFPVDMASGATRYQIQYELGLVARDNGDVERARSRLDEAISLARAAGARIDVVAASNSLGTLLLRISPREAIGIFTECLALLTPDRDGVRIAQILNNLAIAYANAGEWNQSESYYQKSLEIKRIASDYHGQASTLFNMARIYKSRNKLTEARNALSEAASLFNTVRDFKATARAYRELARLDRMSGSSAAAANAHKAVSFYSQAGEVGELDAAKREFSGLLRDQSSTRSRLKSTASAIVAAARRLLPWV